MTACGRGRCVFAWTATALNSRDLQVVANQYDPSQRLPIVPLSDGVGEVVEVGEGVSRVGVGDRVVPTFATGWVAGERTDERWRSHVGGHHDGMLQEYCVLPAEGLCHAPRHLTDAEAAACGVAAATAWEALVERSRVYAGQSVLVQGTGGVAVAAMQLALLHGARVLVTPSSDEKLVNSSDLGAEVTINYKCLPRWDEAVLDATHGEGVDHVIETGGELAMSLACARVGGSVSLAGYSGQLALDSGRPPAFENRVPLLPMLLRGVRVHGIAAVPRESFERCVRAVSVNRLRPVVDRVFGFDDAPEAFRYLVMARHFGKVCISVH
jgi:NADPH:quinone reductase-like Zn-dependent oxidoreductase